ncbi:hypothetical protein BV898_16957 [Hypsibius exemplaris]|uniref:Uncharacterized protein n=1 Tax=Hypsibius exemplaris TaxID=2072580 RepID=A0A9X6RLZ6_HYPEX|nr:hypothetical protein BV898_16957 [Hypsibius exemplaris]
MQAGFDAKFASKDAETAGLKAELQGKDGQIAELQESQRAGIRHPRPERTRKKCGGFSSSATERGGGVLGFGTASRRKKKKKNLQRDVKELEMSQAELQEQLKMVLKNEKPQEREITAAAAMVVMKVFAC